MKKSWLFLFMFAVMAICASVFSGCEPDMVLEEGLYITDDNSYRIENNELSFEAKEEPSDYVMNSQTILVSSSEEFYIEGIEEWMHITGSEPATKHRKETSLAIENKKMIDKGMYKLEIRVDDNPNIEKRVAHLEFKITGKSDFRTQTLEVYQSGLGEYFSASETNIEFRWFSSGNYDTESIIVTSKLGEYDVVCDYGDENNEWFTWSYDDDYRYYDEDGKLSSTKKAIEVYPNEYNKWKTKYGSIKLIPRDDKYQKAELTILISQLGAELFNTDELSFEWNEYGEAYGQWIEVGVYWTIESIDSNITVTDAEGNVYMDGDRVMGNSKIKVYPNQSNYESSDLHYTFTLYNSSYGNYEISVVHKH